MKKEKILIVGGYGAVGGIISTKLSDLYPNQVIVAGRNYQKAKKFASKLNQKAMALEMDVSSVAKDDKRLDNVKLIIMCIDQTDIKFVSQCMKRGIHYIDITANYKFLSKIESLENEAKNYNSTVILSVGLAPGITNLLVKRCKEMVQDMQYADIFIMLGLGEEHGDAAYRWAFEDINDTFFIIENGEKRKVKSFEDGKQANFPNNPGKRTTYRSNFSDQHVLPKTLNIDSVSTRMCFDSDVLTSFYALLRKTGLSKLLKLRIVQDLLIKSLKILPIGSDQFVLKVEVGNQKLGLLYECSVSGNGQGNSTGLVAAKLAEKLYMSPFESGIFNIEQLIDPQDFIESLSDNLRFEERILK